MGEQSPAFGGLVIGTAVLCALAYSLGDGQVLLSFASTLLGYVGGLAAAAWHVASGFAGGGP